MCGVGGIVSLNNCPIINLRARTNLMMSMLGHRGPDYNGMWLEENNKISMINTRLSIVGVDTKFDVPFVSGSKNSIMTYNGEIYNYKYLYNYLSSKKIPLKFKSDTEILIEGLERYGLEFFKLIDGFWSLGFFDKKKNNFF